MVSKVQNLRTKILQIDKYCFGVFFGCVLVFVIYATLLTKYTVQRPKSGHGIFSTVLSSSENIYKGSVLKCASTETLALKALHRLVCFTV